MSYFHTPLPKFHPLATERRFVVVELEWEPSHYDYLGENLEGTINERSAAWRAAKETMADPADVFDVPTGHQWTVYRGDDVKPVTRAVGLREVAETNQATLDTRLAVGARVQGASWFVLVERGQVRPDFNERAFNIGADGIGTEDYSRDVLIRVVVPTAAERRLFSPAKRRKQGELINSLAATCDAG